ncbi:MAG: hypothetical protein Kow0062_03610 [Acidobacteriota bacterium]|nr:MAG: rhodanese-like domain-containing protein [Acidobacteriota bacterium]
MILPISVEELAKLVDGGLVDPEFPGGRVHVFDVRDGQAYLAGHVPGAKHVPPEDNYPLRWIPQRCHTQELVVLIDEDGAPGGTARHVAHELVHKWFRRLRYLEGGFRAWQAAGKPVETGGPAGASAASWEGTRPEVQSSAEVPWVTPQDRR